MAILTSNDLLSNLPINVNINTNVEMEKYVNIAITLHYLGFLGKQTLTDIENTPENFTEEYILLFKQSACFYTYYYALPFMTFKTTPNGLQNNSASKDLNDATFADSMKALEYLRKDIFNIAEAMFKEFAKVAKVEPILPVDEEYNQSTRGGVSFL